MSLDQVTCVDLRYCCCRAEAGSGGGRMAPRDGNTDWMSWTPRRSYRIDLCPSYWVRERKDWPVKGCLSITN